ncbi:hypothetical protein GCM10011581_04570 [Saccharopolyspora subtropica]|uniref:Uncharacterized protein n=1 Tax=Saccharopolyspora thermophila TaxID=89367 RepID=A0A917JJ77_9PSEU|nr:hypothetical protein GCM10011581_04570 [Saccharopolyspora subtropica]
MFVIAMRVEPGGRAGQGAQGGLRHSHRNLGGVGVEACDYAGAAADHADESCVGGCVAADDAGVTPRPAVAVRAALVRYAVVANPDVGGWRDPELLLRFV